MEERERSIEEQESGQEEASLETLFGELDEILKRMEDREISLEESFCLYEDGMKKIRQCNRKLDLVEKRMLVISREGEILPFEPETDEE